MQRRPAPILLLAAALALLVGSLVLLAWLGSSQAANAPQDGTLIAVPTAQPEVPTADGPTACSMAAFGGELTADPKWGIAIRGRDGTVHPMIWPHGYVARVKGDDLELVDPHGQVVGRTGDRIDVTGGETRLGDLAAWGVCPWNIRVQPRGLSPP